MKPERDVCWCFAGHGLSRCECGMKQRVTRAPPKQSDLTPWERIIQAGQDGRGVRLSAAEVAMLCRERAGDAIEKVETTSTPPRPHQKGRSISGSSWGAS